MASISVTFELPEEISTGLALGDYVRNGGVIQDLSGRIIAWLREDPSVIQNTSQAENIDLSDTLNLAFQAVDTTVSQIERLGNVAAFPLTSSVLSLGFTTISFTVIYQQVRALETQLKTVQTSLNLLDEKVDLSFYANFRAALSLARNTFTMQDPVNRQSSALQAIDRFLEVEHVYLELSDKELAEEGQLIDEYLQTLCLAFLAETRCYLELGEYATAQQRLDEGIQQIKQRIVKYIQILLTENPTIYLHPKLTGIVDLPRLTRIYQWFDPSETDSSVFEKCRVNLDKLGDVKTWFQALSPALTQQTQAKSISPVDGLSSMFNIKNGLTEMTDNFWSLVNGSPGIPDGQCDEIFQRLAQVILEIEGMIETAQRLESYTYEVKLLKKTKISFHQWLKISPQTLNTTESNVMFIIPPKALEL